MQNFLCGDTEKFLAGITVMRGMYQNGNEEIRKVDKDCYIM